MEVRMSFRGSIAVAGIACVAIVGCTTASSGDGAEGEWVRSPGEARPESPVVAAERISKQPTQDAREKAVREYTAANPIPDDVRAAKESRVTNPVDPSVGQVSQPLQSACIQHIDGCTDWGIYFDGVEMCWNYSRCTVNVCSGVYWCVDTWG
jgi:hypothetical protein